MRKYFYTIAIFASIVFGIFSAQPASAMPGPWGCDSLIGADNSQCQWWRGLEPGSQGKPGTWGPTPMGPNFYTPCTYDKGCGIGR